MIEETTQLALDHSILFNSSLPLVGEDTSREGLV